MYIDNNIINTIFQDYLKYMWIKEIISNNIEYKGDDMLLLKPLEISLIRPKFKETENNSHNLFNLIIKTKSKRFDIEFADIPYCKGFRFIFYGRDPKSRRKSKLWEDTFSYYYLVDLYINSNKRDGSIIKIRFIFKKENIYQELKEYIKTIIKNFENLKMDIFIKLEENLLDKEYCYKESKQSIRLIVYK